MGKSYKVGKLTSEDSRMMERSIRRQVDIDLDTPIFKHKVHKSLKDYNRKESKRIQWD
jgi:pyocin large subunit-like protein